MEVLFGIVLPTFLGSWAFGALGWHRFTYFSWKCWGGLGSKLCAGTMGTKKQGLELKAYFFTPTLTLHIPVTVKFAHICEAFLRTSIQRALSKACRSESTSNLCIYLLTLVSVAFGIELVAFQGHNARV